MMKTCPMKRLFRRHHCTFRRALWLGLGLTISCSQEPDWRDESREQDRLKEEAIREHEATGLSREDAEAAWWAQEMKWNTEAGGKTNLLRR